MFVAMLMMRYSPGAVLNGAIAVFVEEGEAEEEEEGAEEEDEDIVFDAEENDVLGETVGVSDVFEEVVEDCCSALPTTLCFFEAAIPPPTPPPIPAARIKATPTINNIQNVRARRPQIRDDFGGFSCSSLTAGF